MQQQKLLKIIVSKSEKNFGLKTPKGDRCVFWELIPPRRKLTLLPQRLPNTDLEIRPSYIAPMPNLAPLNKPSTSIPSPMRCMEELSSMIAKKLKISWLP